MEMAVAYYMSHNEGVESGILDKPNQDTGLDLVDLYEVDGVIKTFGSREQARIWLADKLRSVDEVAPDGL